MAVAYFTPTIALDANNNLQRTAEAQVYAAEDTSFSSPLAITDVSGIPFADNKLRAENFFFPAFLPPAGVTQVLIRSGDMVTPMTSISVERAQAVEAASQAAERAGEALAAASAASTAAAAAQAAAEVFAGVVATNDGIMKTVAQDPESEFSRVLYDTMDAVTLGPRFRVGEPILTRRVGACYAGHPWVASSGATGVATYVANDTDSLIGTSSAKLTTTPDATFPTLSATGLTAIDATGCDLRLTFKYEDHAQITAIQLQVSHLSNFSDRHNFQITDVGGAASPAPDGRWFTITIPWSYGTVTGAGATRSAITAMRVVVSRASGQAATYWLGAVDFVKQNSANRWPNGVICLGFDDNADSQWTLALPELDKRGLVGTLFPIIAGLDTAGSLSLAQVHQLSARGWEVAAHATTGARHSAGWDTMSEAEMEDEARALKRWGLEQGFPPSDTFAYPNGRRVAAAEPILARHFNCARLALANRVSNAHPSPIMAIPAVNGGSAAASLNGLVDKVKADKGILPVMYHDFTTGTAAGNTATVASLVTFLDYAQAQGVPFATLGQVLRSAV